LVFIRLSAKTVPRAFFLLLAVITPAQQFFHRKTIMECDVSLRATELDMVVLFCVDDQNKVYDVVVSF